MEAPPLSPVLDLYVSRLISPLAFAWKFSIMLSGQWSGFSAFASISPVYHQLTIFISANKNVAEKKSKFSRKTEKNATFNI